MNETASEDRRERQLDILTNDLRRSIERLDKVIEGSSSSKNKSFVSQTKSPLSSKKKLSLARPKTIAKQPIENKTPMKIGIPPQSPTKKKPLRDDTSEIASIRSMPVHPRKKIEPKKEQANSFVAQSRTILRNSSAHSLGSGEGSKKKVSPVKKPVLPSPKKEVPVLNYQRSNSARP